MKRIEAWAADSPERSRLVIVLTCIALGVLVFSFILGFAWYMLDFAA
ncbi:MAG: hypothetical protein AB7S57_12195 [Acetobacteraceae bacterium]